ncbi:MAG: XTP/dITP diphosphatase [Ruminococcus sp.]|nr:XTP/dITP diphosphatase [Ruminococcus sp.]
MEFIIATNNAKKLKELSRILNPLGINAVSAREVGVNLDEVEETGTTFEENAFLKANAAFTKTNMPAIADDSGLCVDALDGRPGIFSARYSGENATDESNYLKLLDEMKDVPANERTAYFNCSICCILPDGNKIEVNGKCFGEIAFEPNGNGGFGYDPVFMCNGKNFAELSAEEKDAVSHRGQALKKLKEELEKYLINNK